MTFDSMIQRMGRAGRRGGASVFILFTPKWTKIKDPAEIKKRTNGTPSSTSANAQLSNSNRPKLLSKISLLYQGVNTDDDLSESESIAGSKANIDFDKVQTFFLVLWPQMPSKIVPRRKKKSKPAKLMPPSVPNFLMKYLTTSTLLSVEGCFLWLGTMT